MTRKLIKELRTRNVLKIAAASLIAAWLATQFAELILDRQAGPDAVLPSSSPEAGRLPDRKRHPSSLQNSVAVLPFALMSTGPDDDYFANGFTEGIIDALSEIPQLLVMARTSAFHFKGSHVPVDDIAAQLGVAHVVQGTVHRAGGQLQITAQLAPAGTGSAVWSQHYDGEVENVVAIQQDIAHRVAAALGAELDDALRERMRRASVSDVEAIIAFQKGIELNDKAHGEADPFPLLRQANWQFETAIELAARFSDAHLYHADLPAEILLAEASGRLIGSITGAEVSSAPTALQADYDGALRDATDPDLKEVIAFDRALLLGEWRGLGDLARLALDGPGCRAPTWVQLAMPMLEERTPVIAAFERLTHCDPLRDRGWVLSTAASGWDGDRQAALAVSQRGLTRLDDPSIHLAHALHLAASGRGDEALDGIRTHLRNEDEYLVARSMLASIAGEAETAAEARDNFLGKYGPNDQISLILEAALGNRSEANRLAAIIDQRAFGYLVLVHAVFNCMCGAPYDLEATPVFAGLVQDSGLTWPPPSPIAFPLKRW